MYKSIKEKCYCGSEIFLTLDLNTWNQERIRLEDDALTKKLNEWRRLHTNCRKDKRDENVG